MTFKLWKSIDLGSNYEPDGEFDSIEESEEVSGRLDPAYRWYLEDSSGKIVDYCGVFSSVIDQLRKELRIHEKIAFATDDKVLAGILRSMGVSIWDTSTLMNKVAEVGKAVDEGKTPPDLNIRMGDHVISEIKKNFLH